MFERYKIKRIKKNEFDFGLKNFKAFKEMQKIKIKPLTVICGVNNCGKSSLIQGLILLSQSISPSKDDLRIPLFLRRTIRMKELIYKTSLLFEGEICHLSDFSNVLNKFTDEEEFEFYFNFNGNQISLTFFNPSKENMLEAYVKCLELKGDNFELKIISNLDEDQSILDYTLYIKKLSFYDFIRHCPMIFATTRRKIEKEFSEIFVEDYELRNVHVLFNGFIPESVLLPLNVFSNELENIFNKFSEDNKDLIKIFKNFKEDLKHLFEREKGKKLGSLSEPYIEILQYHEKDMIEDFLQTIHYIGPLRDEPHRYYQFYDIRKLSIGNKGEFAPQILILEKDVKITPFQIFSIKNNQLSFKEYKPDNLSLETGLSKWSNILNLPEINPEKVEQTLFKILVNLPKTNAFVTLQDVGFGISQILPVYIEGLRMDNGHTLILEQPEIHLHPNMQSKLADFLLSMAISGKNFIIETHSEYIINRLCLRIAQDQNHKLNNLISIIFIEPPKGDEEAGFQGSIINDLILNKYGEIENWPVGFFDQQDYDKLLKAAIEKRKKEN